MLFAVRLEQENNHKTAALRTHAPHGFEGVDKMSYHGTYPVSKLEVGKCLSLFRFNKGSDFSSLALSCVSVIKHLQKTIHFVKFLPLFKAIVQRQDHVSSSWEEQCYALKVQPTRGSHFCQLTLRRPSQRQSL